MTPSSRGSLANHFIKSLHVALVAASGCCFKQLACSPKSFLSSMRIPSVCTKTLASVVSSQVCLQRFFSVTGSYQSLFRKLFSVEPVSNSGLNVVSYHESILYNNLLSTIVNMFIQSPPRLLHRAGHALPLSLQLL